MLTQTWTVAVLFLLGSCASGLESSAAMAFSSGQPQAATDGGASSLSSAPYNGPAVWITRPDGAQQCAPGTGESLEQSSSELQKAQVRILNSQKSGDHKLHPQMCGISSGKTNTFLIPKDDLAKALTLGFHEIPASSAP